MRKTIQIVVAMTCYWKLRQVAMTRYWKLRQTLRQITAEVTYNVLQGGRIEQVLRDMRESLHEKGESPAR